MIKQNDSNRSAIRISLPVAILITSALTACKAEAPIPPYPYSEVIVDARWQPRRQVIKLADDSDNWPTTWANDDTLYTAYGDGHGFHPGVDRKLSLGIGIVYGLPPNIEGANIHPTNIDFLGDGQYGKKASGLLALDEQLYIWIRNVYKDGTGCTLGRSVDKGRTWTFAEWNFDEFGYCTFLNFGRGNKHAIDDYIYTYTNDDPSAYDNADSFVLMRVHKDRIFDRRSYEFFAGFLDGDTKWTPSVDDRRPVFSHKNRCRRSAVSYNAGLGRYIWWQQSDEADADHRFAPGKFGIYESANPWGPWSTVYFTESWDMPAGESGNFPTKWMSESGDEMYLVFSAYDRFSIRKLTVTYRPESKQLD